MKENRKRRCARQAERDVEVEETWRKVEFDWLIPHAENSSLRPTPVRFFSPSEKAATNKNN